MSTTAGAVPSPTTAPGSEQAPDGAAEGTSHLQRVRRHGLVYGVGFVISRVIGFAMLPVYTRYLGPEHYGILQLLDLAFEIVIIVAGSRLSSGIFHFYHKATTERERHAVLSTTLLLMMATFATVTGAAFVFAPAISQLVFRTPEYAGLVRLGSAGLAFQSVLLVPIAYLQVREWSHRYVIATTLKLILQLVINLVTLVVFGMGVKGVLLSMLIGNAVVGTWLSVQMIRDTGVVLSRGVARSVILFSLPLMAMQVATFLSTYGDRFFLQRAFPNQADGAAAVGIYGLAYQFGFLVNTVAFYPFYNIWEPMRFEIAKRPDRDSLYAHAFVSLNLVYLSIGLALALFVFDLLRIMATPPFLAAATMAPVVMLAYVLQGWTDIQNLGLVITERTSWLSLANWIAAGVALLMYALLIPRYHGMGAAVATLLSFFVRHALVLRMSQRVWPVRYDWSPVLKLLALVTAFVAIGMLLPVLSLIASVAVRIGLLAVYGLVVWVSGIMAESDRAFVRGLVRSPRSAMAGMKGALLGTTTR